MYCIHWEPTGCPLINLLLIAWLIATRSRLHIQSSSQTGDTLTCTSGSKSLTNCITETTSKAGLLTSAAHFLTFVSDPRTFKNRYMCQQAFQSTHTTSDGLRVERDFYVKHVLCPKTEKYTFIHSSDIIAYVLNSPVEMLTVISNFIYRLLSLET